MQERYISSGSSRLHIAVWEPSGERKAIMQISHGMIEYIKRYSHFANYLNQAGILVIGNDHKGHGLTAEKDEDLGYFGEEKSAAVIEDLHEVTRYAKEQYGADVPYFLFGHSMGSFMARRYLMTYGEELTGAIICGTGYTPGAVLTAGKLCAGVISKVNSATAPTARPGSCRASAARSRTATSCAPAARARAASCLRRAGKTASAMTPYFSRTAIPAPWRSCARKRKTPFPTGGTHCVPLRRS